MDKKYIIAILVIGIFLVATGYATQFSTLEEALAFFDIKKA